MHKRQGWRKAVFKIAMVALLVLWAGTHSCQREVCRVWCGPQPEVKPGMRGGTGALDNPSSYGITIERCDGEGTNPVDDRASDLPLSSPS